MATLTVIVPAFNEEAYIAAALRSVRFADEIIVIDSFSTDRTPEIAQKYTTVFLQREFDNFSNQKNHALQYATKEWVLFLDADERITYPLQQEIIQAIDKGKHNGYILHFIHFYMNRFLYNHSSNVLRLVKRENVHFTGLVHEKLHCGGTVGKLSNTVLHFTYKGLDHVLQKKEKYAWFQAEQLYKKGRKASWYHLFFKPAYRFFSSFIIKGGFRDGIPGMTLAVVNAYGVFQRYVKLLLLQKGMH